MIEDCEWLACAAISILFTGLKHEVRHKSTGVKV
jgi:hypothetical protein